MASRREVLAGAPSALAAMVPGQVNRSVFGLDRIYLDAAFTHPFGRFAADAARSYAAARQADPRAVGPARNARKGAVAAFAGLVSVAPDTIAVVPSTMAGENLLVHALGIGPDAGVITDAYHYDGSLALYGEKAREGTPVAVIAPRGGRIELADIERAITPQTRLVAISLVSSLTGFTHDLAELCALAHRKGALVYADIIQAAGAIPLDLAASGVDFACCGTYKWLMGDFGCAFLYVRPDRLERLRRVDVGWRQVASQESHVLPFESPGPAGTSYRLGTGTAGRIEVSTPAWQALAVAQASIAWLDGAGVAALAGHRAELLARLAEGLRGSAWRSLTPGGSAPVIGAYSLRDAASRIDARLAAAGITVSTYPHHVRVSPSLYNDAADIDRLVAVMRGV